MSPKKTEVTAEIIAGQFGPAGRAFAVFDMPALKLQEGLTIIALRVAGSATVKREVLEEFGRPFVRGERRLWRGLL
jgi:hypothetical protein